MKKTSSFFPLMVSEVLVHELLEGRETWTIIKLFESQKKPIYEPSPYDRTA